MELRVVINLKLACKHIHPKVKNVKVSSSFVKLCKECFVPFKG